MPYSITTKDGITLRNIPDDIPQDSPQLKARVETIRGGAAGKSAEPDQSFGDKVIQQGKNLLGALRGAASIGATLTTPVAQYDKAGNKDPRSFLDRRSATLNEVESATKTMGADPASMVYQGAKLGTEIAGTAGVGGALANGARAVPMLAGRAAPVIDAISTAGMRAGGATGAAGLAARTVGGAITGGASAGIVNPEDAATGALVGGALPGVAQVAGKIGGRIGQTIRRPAQSADMAAAIAEARRAGYVIPPTQANPSLGNRVLEGFSGKITTAQNASAKNQAVTGKLAAEALGLPGDTKLTADVLKNVRQSAGQAYDAIGSTGAVTPPAAYGAALDNIAAPFVKSAQAFPNAKPSPVLDLVESLRSPSFDAGAAVEKIKQLRTAADDAFRTGNTDVARASKAAAGALEDALDSHLQSVGQPAMLQAFRDARQLIAKTYTVEKALNPTTGAVDARKLAAQLTKGKPLSGELKTAAQFAARFPKAAQTVEGMGSLPQTSPLDWVPAGALSMATANPLMMLGVGARPAARSLILSPAVQNGLLQRPSSGLGLLSNPDLAQLGYQAAPIALTGR